MGLSSRKSAENRHFEKALLWPKSADKHQFGHHERVWQLFEGSALDFGPGQRLLRKVIFGGKSGNFLSFFMFSSKNLWTIVKEKYFCGSEATKIRQKSKFSEGTF